MLANFTKTILANDLPIPLNTTIGNLDIIAFRGSTEFPAQGRPFFIRT
jgi:hypothetical protein